MSRAGVGMVIERLLTEQNVCLRGGRRQITRGKEELSWAN